MLPVQAPEVHPVEYLVIVLYLIFLALVGPMMRRFNSDSDDYFRGGARGTWWITGPSLAMSMVSATVFTGVAGAIYEAGIAPLANNVAQWIAGGLLIAFLAARFRRLRAVTAAEVIRQRFGPVTEQFYAYLHAFLTPMYGAFQLLGLAMFVGAVFHLPVFWVVVGLGVVVAFYSVPGGRWAVLATDFLQALVMFPVVAAVAFLSLRQTNGLANLYERLAALDIYHATYPEGAFADNYYTVPWVIATFAVMFVMQLNIGYNSRFFSVKDEREASRAAGLMITMMIVGTVFFSIPALAARVLYPEQVASYAAVLNKAVESSYVVVCLNVLPVGLLGLVLVAMFSATASSMDTGLNTNAAIIVRNVMPPLRRLLHLPELDRHSEIVWGRRITLALSAIVIGITLMLVKLGSGGIFELVINFGAMFNLPMGLPFFLILLFPNAPRSSALFAIAGGIIPPWTIMPILSALGHPLAYDERVFLVLGCALAGFCLSYFFPGSKSPAAQAETTDFYANMERPIDFEAEVGRANDTDQLLFLGRTSLMLAAGMLCLMFVPNSTASRLVIIAISCVIGVVGSVLWTAGKRRRKRGL